jgi:hypothetical protein
MTSNFPNFFTAVPRAFCNFPRCAEVVVEWVTNCIRYMEQHGITKIEPTPEAEVEWDEHSQSFGRELLLVKSNVKSWFNGGNIPGKKVKFLLYANTLPGFREKVEGVANNGYEGFELHRLGDESPVSLPARQLEAAL